MIFLILNFLRALVVFIKALLNATYEINPIDYSHKTVAHYNTYHTSITEWSILKPLITVLRTWYILPVHYISVQYSHSNSTPYMDTPNCPVMDGVGCFTSTCLLLAMGSPSSDTPRLGKTFFVHSFSRISYWDCVCLKMKSSDTFLFVSFLCAVWICVYWVHF